MTDFLFALDVALLEAVNVGWAHPVLDALTGFVTEFRNFLPVVVPLSAWWLWKGGRRGRRLVVALGVSVLLTDPLCARVLKPLVGRERPCVALPGCRAPAGVSTSPSFPSNHAANAAGAMTVLARAHPGGSAAFAAFAGVVGLSRVYQGKHWPSDVAAGFGVGILAGLLAWRLTGWGENRIFRHKGHRERKKEGKREGEKARLLKVGGSLRRRFTGTEK